MSAIPDRSAADRLGPDPYGLWDAAYVLGALSPAERREFEEHVSTCRSCGSSVAEVAGLPGLLGQVGPEDAALLTESSGVGAAAPPDVLPEVLASVHQRRSRLTRLLVGLAAGLVLVLGGAAIGRELLAAQVEEPQRLAFTAVKPSNITAVVDLVPVSAGTQLEVECQYGATENPDPDGHYARYSIVVTDRSGRASEVKNWPVSVNKVMRPSAVTPLRPSEIRDVEIRETATNDTVLRAELR